MRLIQVKSSSSSSSNAKSSTPATAKRKNDSDKRVECIESGESYGLNSDEGKLTDCINLVDGMPKELNLTVEGTINGKPVNLQLYSGAEVSVIFQDFVKPDDIIATYVYLKGVDHIRVKAPRYVLPFKVPGVRWKMFVCNPSQITTRKCPNR